jgi:hypothetical protein
MLDQARIESIGRDFLDNLREADRARTERDAVIQAAGVTCYLLYEVIREVNALRNDLARARGEA